MVKLIFTAYKTTDKFFFIIIFAIYKSCTRILSKKNNEIFSKNTCRKYQNLSEEEKDKRSQNAHEQNRNLSEG